MTEVDSASPYLPLQLNITSSESTQTSSFSAEPVRIISKPTRKKNIAKFENRIYSGSVVSLFNRIASQTTSTSFLSTCYSKICLDANHWDPVECFVVMSAFLNFFFIVFLVENSGLFGVLMTKGWIWHLCKQYSTNFKFTKFIFWVDIYT